MFQSFLWNDQTLIAFLTEEDLSKLDKTLLSLKNKIFEAVTNQNRIKAIHQYTFFLSLVIENMNENSRWRHYFIKDTIYYVINLIHNLKNSDHILTLICNFLMAFLKQIVPEFCETFCPMLQITINSLKYFYKTLDSVKELCLNMMHFLIVENSCHLMESIEKLDNFPNTPEFDGIRTVHSNIRYGNRKPNLEQEINFFLQHHDVSTRFDSLVHLRNTLSEQKHVLKHMYDKLQDQRGFSEDCEVSLLHRLIAMLANMSCSTNEKVSFFIVAINLFLHNCSEF